MQQSVVWVPILDQLFWAKTIHSLLATVVPADVAQSVFGLQILDFLTKIWSFVPVVVPATSQPLSFPGSAPSTPTTSIKIKVPAPLSFTKPTASFPFQDTFPLIKSAKAKIVSFAPPLAII